ncbi:hypothetical protein ACFONG_04305 [Uliginosibacterium paludis]|jgi:hypothetical protein|uniref:Uncharacterized protein n=1 Tax=Uliginosibacterium paludis TaxID=1615952 RepID=A0ABV2CNB8_9RHOO
MNERFPDTLVPHKTLFGARLIATPDPSLSAALRRLLLLADGHRNIGTLAMMMPERDIQPDLGELVQRGLLETSPAGAPARRIEPDEHGHEDLPEGWETASGFMAARARESLGVKAVEVIEALEHARDPEEARHAMSQWYRAMRNSREGRLQADVDRIKAAALLRSQLPA